MRPTLATHCTDTSTLRARQVLAGAFAAALAEPASTLGRRKHGDLGDVLSQAWRDACDACEQATSLADVGGAEGADRSIQALGIGEMAPAGADVAPLARWLAFDPATRHRAHQAVFGLVISKQCPAYETEYSHTRDATYRAHQMADIAGFFAAFGVAVADDDAERCDHVALELEFVAFLLTKLEHAQDEAGADRDEHRAICRDALHDFVRHHVAWWMPTFARCLEKRVDQIRQMGHDALVADAARALAGVGRVLRAWVCVERTMAGVEPNQQVVAPQVDIEPDAMTCATCALSGALTSAAPATP